MKVALLQFIDGAFSMVRPAARPSHPLTLFNIRVSQSLFLFPSAEIGAKFWVSSNCNRDRSRPAYLFVGRHGGWWQIDQATMDCSSERWRGWILRLRPSALRRCRPAVSLVVVAVSAMEIRRQRGGGGVDAASIVIVRSYNIHSLTFSRSANALSISIRLAGGHERRARR